jgi:hypothetical protein
LPTASDPCRNRKGGIELKHTRRRLFTFTRLPPSQWKSARTTNAIERLHEEFKRWALLASGPDQHAQGRWLADTRLQANRSAN